MNLSVTIIGSGNMAFNLANAIKQNGINISCIYGRNQTTVHELATMVNAKAVFNINEVNTNSAVYIIAVNDDQIAHIAQSLPKTNGVVVHTSGNTAMQNLGNRFSNVGVFYPFQTVTKSKLTSFAEIPVLLEANNETSNAVLTKLANAISKNVRFLNSEQRQNLHLSAVMVNNFTNHLATLAQTNLEQHNIDFDLLKPLIKQTYLQIENEQAKQAQTGPAIRKDKETIKQHLQLLNHIPTVKKLYKQFTRSIQQTHKSK